MFLNALMLLGLGAAVLPVVLHLLSRARFRTVDWGAMMFLEGGDPRQTQSSRFSQLVLLLIRMAIVAVLALALARPVLRGRYGTPGKGQPTLAVLLLDCSASMGFDENGHPRILHAKAAAKQVLAVHKGDPVSLVLMGLPQRPDERRPTTDLWDVARRVESAEPGHARADVARALDEAAEALASRRPTTPARAEPGAAKDAVFATVYVIADRQASNWQGADDVAFKDRWRDRLRRAGVEARLVFIPVGAADADNVVVQSVELVGGSAVVNQPAEVEVRLRNFGGVQWASLPLTVTLDKRPIYEQRVSLAPDGAASLRIPIREYNRDGFRAAGTHVIAAGVSTGRSTGLTSDDRLETAVEVTEPVKVLVVSGDAFAAAAAAAAADRDAGDRKDDKGDAAGEDFRGAGALLPLALAPFKTSKREGPDPCTVDVIAPEAWAGPTVTPPKRSAVGDGKEVKLGAYQVVVLANVERLTPPQVLAVEQFVYDGGGLLVAPGSLSRPDEYDRQLYRGGAGVLPAALGEPTAGDGSQQTALSGFDPQHRVFRFLRGRPDAFLSTVVGRYFPVTERSGAARVLAQYVSGDPFLVGATAGSVGRGRVLLMTTSLDAEWTTLPQSSFYLPFAQSAVRYLADAAPRRLNLSPGEPIEVAFDEPTESRVVRVTLPDGTDRPLELPPGSQAGVARYNETDQPGVYQVRVTEPANKRTYAVHYVVRPPRDESDLTALVPEQLRQMEASLDLEVVDAAERPVNEATVGAPAPRELWAWLLGCAFVLAVVEMALGRAWSRE